MTEAKDVLPRLHMVYSMACELKAYEGLSTELLMKHMQVMALDMEPSIDESLLKSEIDDLKKAHLRKS